MTRLFIIGLSIYCIVIALSIAMARAQDQQFYLLQQQFQLQQLNSNLQQLRQQQDAADQQRRLDDMDREHQYRMCRSQPYLPSCK